MIYQQTLSFACTHRGAFNITAQINAMVADAKIEKGICQLFVKHTSASLIICENADADVLLDLENFLATLVKDGNPSYLHSAEGADDMAAHIRSILTQTALSLPINNARLDLGIWQGIFLYEHRTQPHQRYVSVTVLGE